MVRIFTGIDDLAAAVGAEAGHSSWHVVEQDRIDAFAGATGDSQWIHTQPERAALGPFGGAIAHGYLTLALVSAFMAETFEVAGAPMIVNYGLNRVRFPSPVMAGSRLRGRVHLLEVTEVAHGHLLVSRVTVEVDGAVKPACVAEVLTLFPKRTEESS